MKSWRIELDEEPGKFDFLNLLWTLERSAGDKPRIGRAEVLSQEIVKIGQDPFLAFPGSNITYFHQPRPDARAEVRERFLGFFGPQGALPLTTTIESYRWSMEHDDSFARFADIFLDRFVQLFYRAWADARPIVQIGRPDEDRFRSWVGSAAGIGTPALQDRDSLPDVAKLRFAGLIGSRVKSARRLQQLLKGLLGVDLEIRERVASWLEFEPQDLTRLGSTGASLGQSTHLGSRVQSINDKITVTIRTRALDEYESFLPGQPRFRQIVDLIYLYMGALTDVDLELELPAAARPAARLGQVGQLGWTAWAAPETSEDEAEEFVVAATFAAHEDRIPAAPASQAAKRSNASFPLWNSSELTDPAPARDAATTETDVDSAEEAVAAADNTSPVDDAGDTRPKPAAEAAPTTEEDTESTPETGADPEITNNDTDDRDNEND